LAGDMAYHAFLYTHGTMMDLGTFGGTSSQPYGLNEQGQVVGYASTAANAEVHAFLFTKGTMIDHGLLIAAGSSYALDFKNSGQVLVEHTGLGRSFLYDKGTVTDLTELVYTQFGRSEFFATGINDAGWIVGYARATSNSGYSAVLLSPGP